jgi:outer membrane protein OmpA-like peptidoglycan-associated protein
MVKKPKGWVALGIFTLGTTHAWAQDQPSATGSVAMSTSTGTEASATSEAPATSGAAATSGGTFEPYEAGYPPDNNLLELGVFGGIFFPAGEHNLRDESLGRQRALKISPELGARLGWYPLSFLGIEGEVMAARSKVKGVNTRAMAYSGRGNLVLQAPLPYVVPFVTGGVGKLGLIGETMGSDADVAWNFGVGAKVPLTHGLSLRIDGRDNLTARTGGDGQAHSFELLLGLTAVIGRARNEPPAPPADSDRDGVLDRDDKCPAELGVAPSGCPADSDGDSVLDRDDYCPKEAGPAPKGCPIIDTDPDKDGVPLPCDACPTEVGVKPDGCPIRDTDKDGILDDKDKCVKEPETKNGFEDSDGCPDTIPEKLKKFTGVVEGIYFDVGKATIRNQSTPKLEGAANVLKEFPSISMEISGHTSSEGDPAFNQKLSQDRADAVKQWLVEKGIPSQRIKTRGAGPDEPIANNKTPAGKIKNRRIEFKVIQ